MSDSSTLSDPMDCSLPGSSVHGIFQARVLEWGAIAFSFIKLHGIYSVKKIGVCDFLTELYVFVCMYVCVCVYMNKVYVYTYEEKAMAPHSRTLAWKIPWREEPGRL